jgi:hypothetical protein
MGNFSPLFAQCSPLFRLNDSPSRNLEIVIIALAAQKLGGELKSFVQQHTAILIGTEKIVQDWIGRLWIGLMRSGGEQLHGDWNQRRQKLHDELGIQTGALPNFSDYPV